MKEFEIDYTINFNGLLYLEGEDKEKVLEYFKELNREQFPDWFCDLMDEWLIINSIEEFSLWSRSLISIIPIGIMDLLTQKKN